ncbi:hypothetical protein HPB49_007643 [Dermacentor silvarum]|uniref:Uncharacterized protein n=1 Tax=Dermacentor silvarum TaxID=543639 RepID=A0ACB8CW85_DERSI|nr:hypothetical protein HPB49_007643 [Dermacentor silvarum]
MIGPGTAGFGVSKTGGTVEPDAGRKLDSREKTVKPPGIASVPRKLPAWLTAQEGAFAMLRLGQHIRGSPPLESRVGVAVKVTDIAMPTFGQHFYTTSVAEDVAPGTALLTVQAKGAHPLIFSLASDHFAIDRATG